MGHGQSDRQESVVLCCFQNIAVSNSSISCWFPNFSPLPLGKYMGRRGGGGGEVSWGHWEDGQDLNPLTHPAFSWGEKGGHWKELGFAPPPSPPFSRGRGGAHWWLSWDLTSPDPHPPSTPTLLHSSLACSYFPLKLRRNVVSCLRHNSSSSVESAWTTTADLNADIC